MELPKLVGPAAMLEPPFQFKNVATCVFPLRAQLDSLQRFVDAYLNIIPEELGYFRASMPYVMLMMLDYGKLAAQVTNFGWFSQREVAFFVPLEWYKRVRGEWVFHDFATVTPFVYVDSQMSMTLGRTALGWPKTLVNLSPTLTGWISDPIGATTDAIVSAQVFPKSYADAHLEERRFMEVRSPTYSSLHLPFNPEDPFAPWTLWSNFARSMSGLTRDFFGFLSGTGIVPPHEGSSAENFARKSRRAIELASQAVPWAPNLCGNCLTFKQFRRADDPKQYCYQALLNGPMRITAFSRGALIGQSFGDTSGGYEIDLVNWPNFPIVDTLGLHAERIASVEGPDVARLKPVFPFWYEVNMVYDRTSTIAWRTEDGTWRDDSGTRYRSARGLGSKLYNTASGAANPVITGPFRFPSVDLQVLPLLARRDALEDLIETYLNAPLGPDNTEHFELFGPEQPAAYAYVYFVAIDWGDVRSDTNNIGDWADKCTTFFVPVKRYVKGALSGAGLFPAQMFASDTTQACTFTELYGIPAVAAELTRPPIAGGGAYLEEPRSLLKITAETLLSVGEGQAVEQCTILELCDRGGRSHDEQQELTQGGEQFCTLLRAEVARKNAVPAWDKRLGRAGALQILAGGQALDVYTMKQFPDAGTPRDACYQALVRIPYVFEEIHQIEEIPRSMCVKIALRPTYPIVETLGLVTRDVVEGDGSSVYILEAVRPFFMRVGLSLQNGEHLQYRSGMSWVATDAKLRQNADAVDPSVLTEVDEQLSTSNPCYIKRMVRAWLEQQTPASLIPRVGLPEKGVVRPWLLADPQTVIESMLSREWEDRSSASTLRLTRERLAHQFRRDEAGWGSWLEDNLRWLNQLTQEPNGSGSETTALQALDADTVHWLRRLEQLSLALDQAVAPNPGWQQSLELSWQLWNLAHWDVLPLALSESACDPIRDELARVLLLSKEGFSSPEVRAACAGVIRQLLRCLYPIAEERLEHALNRAVARLRKPDHCVLRSTAGRERSRLFPLEQSWDEVWYCGKDQAS